VFVVRENNAVEVPVILGKQLGALVEIQDGLTAGEKVIASVTGQIVSGVAVKVQ
jgi:hypothetical protein